MSAAEQLRRMPPHEAVALDCGRQVMSAQELRKLIVKLRWIGCDDQAELLQMSAPPGFVALEPSNTD